MGVEEEDIAPGDAGKGELLIRRVQPDDQDRAKQLVLAGLEEHWGYVDQTLNPDLQDICLTYATGVFLVALADAELIGTGALMPEEPGAGRITRMSVTSKWRRRGVGRRILQALLDEARRVGYERVVLETTATWGDATGFYRRNGFRALGVWNGDMHFVKVLAESA